MTIFLTFLWRVPKPLPVPPPRECMRKKDCKESQGSAVRRILSIILSAYFGPYASWLIKRWWGSAFEVRLFAIYPSVVESLFNVWNPPILRHLPMSPIVAGARYIFHHLSYVKQFLKGTFENIVDYALSWTSSALVGKLETCLHQACLGNLPLPYQPIQPALARF